MIFTQLLRIQKAMVPVKISALGICYDCSGRLVTGLTTVLKLKIYYFYGLSSNNMLVISWYG